MDGEGSSARARITRLPKIVHAASGSDGFLYSPYLCTAREPRRPCSQGITGRGRDRPSPPRRSTNAERDHSLDDVPFRIRSPRPVLGRPALRTLSASAARGQTLVAREVACPCIPARPVRAKAIAPAHSFTFRIYRAAARDQDGQPRRNETDLGEPSSRSTGRCRVRCKGRRRRSARRGTSHRRHGDALGYRRQTPGPRARRSSAC